MFSFQNFIAFVSISELKRKLPNDGETNAEWCGTVSASVADWHLRVRVRVMFESIPGHGLCLMKLPLPSLAQSECPADSNAKTTNLYPIRWARHWSPFPTRAVIGRIPERRARPTCSSWPGVCVVWKYEIHTDMREKHIVNYGSDSK